MDIFKKIIENQYLKIKKFDQIIIRSKDKIIIRLNYHNVKLTQIIFSFNFNLFLFL